VIIQSREREWPEPIELMLHQIFFGVRGLKNMQIFCINPIENIIKNNREKNKKIKKMDCYFFWNLD
jgi:hypothetical protein